MFYNQNSIKKYNSKNSLNKNMKSLKIKQNTFILDSLLNEFEKFFYMLFQKKPNKELFFSIEKVFKYYLNFGVEEVFLFINNYKSCSKIILKVMPSYKNNFIYFSEIEDILKEDTHIVSLKDFYRENFKKYCN